jgi:small-conductance mechanosensitive channel
MQGGRGISREGTVKETFAEWIFHPVAKKIFILLLGLLFISIVVKALQRYIGQFVKDSKTRYRLRKFSFFLGFLVAGLFIAVVFSDHLGGLHIAFGLIGAGVAFSLQEVVASIAGWMAVTLGDSYSVGDRIKLSGITGDVIDIGIIKTTLMECGDWVQGDLYNGRIVRLSNSFVFREPVYNYSTDFPFLWDEITLPIRHGSDYQRAKDLILGVLNETVGEYAAFAGEHWQKMVRKYRIEDASVTPMVTVTPNENWLLYTIRYVVDYKERRSKKDHIYMRLLEEIGKAGDGISLASTSMDVNLFTADGTAGKESSGR